MTITLDLTPEQEAALRSEAARNGQDLAGYVLHRLLGEAPGVEPMGAEVLADLYAAGVIGTFADRPDSPQWARELRQAVEHREL